LQSPIPGKSNFVVLRPKTLALEFTALARKSVFHKEVQLGTIVLK
jgi:hypothetical protein